MADANFRSLTQEALARINRSLAFDEQLSAGTVNRLMDESIASEQLWLLERAGPEVAEVWRLAVLATIGFLQTRPLVGRDRKDLKHPRVRSWRVNRFRRGLIFYGVREDVLILHRVSYGTMDLLKAAFD